MTMILYWVHHIWNWIVGFTGTVALIFLIISIILVLIEIALYHSKVKTDVTKESDSR